MIMTSRIMSELTELMEEAFKAGRLLGLEQAAAYHDRVTMGSHSPTHKSLHILYAQDIRSMQLHPESFREWMRSMGDPVPEESAPAVVRHSPVKSYKLKRGAVTCPEAVAGSVVYDSLGCDYGCAADDTRIFGREHVSMTLDPMGGYPFFTVPRDDLIPILPGTPVPAKVSGSVSKVFSTGRWLDGSPVRPGEFTPDGKPIGDF